MRYRRGGGGRSGNWRTLMTVLAIVASVALVTKIVRGIHRGETMQSQVKPL